MDNKEKPSKKMHKEWVGNAHSSFAAIGASNHSDYEREVNDFYATDPKMAEELMKLVPLSNVWECACGQGHLAKVFDANNLLGKASDLIDRGYGETGIDFLGCSESWNGDIVTNPPYKWAREFCMRALDLVTDGHYVCMFLKLTFLEGAERWEKLFSKTPPQKVWVSVKRAKASRNGDADLFEKSSAVCYAWYVWQKGWNGDTAIGWFNTGDSTATVEPVSELQMSLF